MGMKGKIFCIGMDKTGTTSLHKALNILGLKSVHNICDKGDIKEIIINNNKYDRMLLFGIEEYDAYSDWSHRSTSHLFKEFDRQYPGSKFILTTRDLEDWMISREKHVRRTPDLKELQKKYDYSHYWNMDKEAWRKEWLDLHEDALSYFKDRPEDLLVINICAGEGWEKLCPFLGVRIPKQPFPKENQAK